MLFLHSAEGVQRVLYVRQEGPSRQLLRLVVQRPPVGARAARQLL